MEIMDLPNAESIFTRIIARDENFTEAWNKRATIRYMRGDFDGSERYRRSPVRALPGNVRSAMINMAR